MIEIYCDGSSKNNGKKDNCGGWGMCVLIPDERYLSGYRLNYYTGCQTTNTTNNREELKALLEALEQTQGLYKNELCVIYTDSAYCVNIFNEWIYSWYQRGWLRAGDKPIENLDLIKQLWEYTKISFPNFTVRKVSGHAGVLGNEIADAIACNDQAKLKEIFEKNDIMDINPKKIDIQ
jgi:ribonuclease HI